MVAALLLASEGAHESGSLLARYLDLVTDPAHLLMEATLILVVDVILGMLLWPLVIRPLALRWVARHDEQHHHGHMSEEEHV